MKATYVILDEPFPAEPNESFPQFSILAHEKTAVVTRTDDNGKVTERRYGVVTAEEVYAKIDAKQEINLNRCFIEGFSLSVYKHQRGLNATARVELPELFARSSWWKDRIDFSSATFSGAASFYSTIFGDEADFGSVTFNDYAFFSSATFSSIANFRSAIFIGDTKFLRATFNGKAFFDSAIFHDATDFGSAIFHDATDFHSAIFSGTTTGSNFSSVIFRGIASFYSATFSSEAYFQSATFSGRANFLSATFSGRANFLSATFSGEANFHSATFSGESYFRSATFSGKVSFVSASLIGRAEFYATKFDGDTSFFSAKFSNKVYFCLATFSGVTTFREATFNLYANFVYATFCQDVYFTKVSIKSKEFACRAVFDSAHFKQNVWFDELEVKQETSEENQHTATVEDEQKHEISFNTTIFNGAVSFTKAEIASGIFTSTFFQYPVSFIEARFDNIDLTGTVFATYAVFNSTAITSSGAHARQTYRAIKHELVKTNNLLDAGQYYRKEMEAYYAELKEKGWKKHLLEKFVLFFNRISNNYGTSLRRALGFWIGVSIGFFAFFSNLGVETTYFQWGWNGWGEFLQICITHIRYVLQFMFPAHSFEFMGSQYKLNDYGYIIDTIGRVAIGYGYFQIVQALRKFKTVN